MKIPTPADFLPAAKAWCALVGTIATALLGTVAPDSALFDILTAVSAVTTAIAVYRVPNKTRFYLKTGPGPNDRIEMPVHRERRV